MDINKIKNKQEVKKDVPQKSYRVKITDEETGEILYDHASKGGVLCSMEQIFKMTGAEIEGNHQLTNWGHIFTQLYARDRINEFIEEKTPEILKAMEEVGVKLDPQIKKIVLENYKK